MARLIARTPFADMLPIGHGTLIAREVDPGPITSIAVTRGSQRAVSKALTDAMGIPLAETGRFVQATDLILAWAGLDTWFAMGATVPQIDGAMPTDQSDAWAVADLTGPDIQEALARLVPINLSDLALPVGAAARTSFGHMASLLLRTGPESYRVMVFRSMAGTAAHEMDRVMRNVAARANLTRS